MVLHLLSTILQHYSTLVSVLVSLTIHAHSVLPIVSVPHLSTPLFLKSNSTSSIHLLLGLPYFLLLLVYLTVTSLLSFH